MKKLLFLIVTIFLFLYTGCSDDNSTGGVDPFGGGGGGGGTGNVNYTVRLVQDQQQQTYFELKPDKNVVITKVVAQCQAIGVNQDIPNIPTDVFSNAEPLYIGPVTVNLQTGQAWTFNIQGNIGSATGQAYNVNVNYTIP